MKLLLTILLISYSSLITYAQYHGAAGNAARLAGEITPPTTADYYVSPTGSDANSGTELAPFETIQKAVDVAVAGEVIEVKGGYYNESVIFNTSGTAGSPITLKAHDANYVELTAMEELTGWTNYSGNIYYATFDDAVMPRYNLVVFDNGEFLSEGTWSNTTTEANRLLNSDYTPIDSYSSNSTTSSSLTTFADNELVGSEIYLRDSHWHLTQRTITGNTQATGTVTWAENISISENFEFILLNNLGFLNNERGWYLDEAANRLYVRLQSDEDPSTHTIEVRNRINCFDFNGQDNITLQGIDIVGGEVLTENSDGITLDGNHFKFNDWAFGYVFNEVIYTMMEFDGTNNQFINNEVEGVCQRFMRISGSNNIIANNYFHDNGYRNRDGAAISIAGSSEDLIVFNTFKNHAHSVIEGGPAYRTEVAYNDFDNFNMLSDDVGGIGLGNNSYGASIIHHNVFHNTSLAQSSGIYFDNASSNAVVYNNISYNTGWGMRFNFPQYNLLAYNNTHYNSGNIYGNSGTDDYSSVGVKIFNNTYTGVDGRFITDLIPLTGNIATTILYDDIYTDVLTGDFTLKASSPAINYGIDVDGISKTAGALEYGETMWNYGHDFNTPPTYVYNWIPKPFINNVANEGFESDLDFWTTNNGTAETFYTNSFTLKDDALGKGGAYSLKMSPNSALSQTITDLIPETTYEVGTYTRLVGYDYEIWDTKTGSSGTFDLNYVNNVRGIADLDNGEYVWWDDIDFGTNKYNRIELLVTDGATINVELRLDGLTGTLLHSGVLSYDNIASWNFSRIDIGNYSGLHSVYLKFISAATASDRIGYIRFIDNSTSERISISETGGGTADIGGAYWTDLEGFEFTTGVGQTSTTLTLNNPSVLDAYVDIIQLVEKEIIATPTGGVTLFSGDNLTGTSENIGLGLTNLTNNNSATSIKIPYGYKVTCYDGLDGTGNSRQFVSDVLYMYQFTFDTGGGMNDAISSVLVELID